MATRWGIAAAGRISHDFAVALSVLDPKQHRMTAVAARDLNRANEFATLHKIPKAYDDYERIATDPEIDVVYIGSVNNEHKRLAIMMLQNGKHVLCEKPMCLNEKDTRELCALAKQKKLVLLEGLWSRFLPAYRHLKNAVDDGLIGDVQQICINFAVPIANVQRLKERVLGGGSIHDLGVYTLQFAELFFGKDYESITALGELNEQGMDECVAVVIKYANGKLAQLSTNARALGSNEAEIVGTKGFIRVPTFWCPDSIVYPSGEQKFPFPHSDKFLNFVNSTGLSHEAQAVRECILNGRLEHPYMSHDDSIYIAKLRDVIRKQIGMTQEGDD